MARKRNPGQLQQVLVPRRRNPRRLRQAPFLVPRRHQALQLLPPPRPHRRLRRLTKLASQNSEKLDWRKSIVDLMKLLKLDSSLPARKELAKELHYDGDTNDSAAMNIWLHKQVMIKLAQNGGKVPEDLKA
jgi:hypothetical protein